MGVKVREKEKGSGVWYVFISHQGRRKSKRIGKDKRLAREVASFSDEEELQGLVDFFTEALERHRKIDEGINAEVIPLNDKPNERG